MYTFFNSIFPQNYCDWSPAFFHAEKKVLQNRGKKGEKKEINIE